MTELTLLRRQSPLADPSQQVVLLETQSDIPSFAEALEARGATSLRAAGIAVLQVNLGKVCNQTCRHCHVDAGPDRRESMSRMTAEHCVRVLQAIPGAALDITGGAPEMNPNFRWLVEEARALGRHVMDRCNLTILLAPGFTDLPEFLARHEVEIVASLPCYLEENVDRQRGDQVFKRSLLALRRLNSLGYGMPGSSKTLNLVFNPGGTSLPPQQSTLEDEYRRELRSRYQVEFTNLLTITNMPISRFLDDLLTSGRYEAYMHKLVNAFNLETVRGLMCRSTLSVDWQGTLYDCDFNQMLELGLAGPGPRHISELNETSLQQLFTRPIVTGRHCFGCTAGAGSSCGGSLVG